MAYFVQPGSIVRKIWGSSDTILFIFAGAAAEFALNKEVDWLYFTGRLPADPMGRLFSTVGYAREIVFAPKEEAERALAKINAIHAAVEKGRGYRISNWAYRDVLFMLIFYSIAAFELLKRKLTADEKEEVYQVFLRVGQAMHIPDLPATYADWLPVREAHLQADLVHSDFTSDLFCQYKKSLGAFRYSILREGQMLVVPKTVARLLRFRKVSWLLPVVPLYKICSRLKLDSLVKALLLPPAYKKQILALDIATS